MSQNIKLVEDINLSDSSIDSSDYETDEDSFINDDTDSSEYISSESEWVETESESESEPEPKRLKQ